MPIDFFRSESEYSSKLTDPTVRCVSNCTDQDTVIFYSVQYEEDLLMKYLGESSGLGESVCESDAEFTNFDPFISGEIPSYGYIDPTRLPVSFPESSFSAEMKTDFLNVVSNEDTQNRRSVSVEQQPYVTPARKPSRRGRPSKATSTSKMAYYARNYREQKKNQLLAYEAQIKELTEENQYLRSENKRLTNGFTRLTEQVNNLRKMIERNSYTYQDPLQTPYFSQRYNEKDSTSDILDISSSITFPQ